MKLIYEPGQPDRDDTSHRHAVSQGLVGPKCVLGGTAIDAYRAFSPNDICVVCVVRNAERDRCEGRLRVTETPLPIEKTTSPDSTVLDVEGNVSHSTNQTAAAYRLRHERQADKLRELFLQAEAAELKKDKGTQR